MLDFLRSCRVYLERTAVYGLISLFTSQQVPPKAYLNTIGIQAMRIDWARKLMNYRRRKKKKNALGKLISLRLNLPSWNAMGLFLSKIFYPTTVLRKLHDTSRFPSKNVMNNLSILS